MDNKIRPAYLGGSSDYFYFYGENLKYYDINSLYPFAMLQDMPLDYIGEFEGSSITLDECFGFVEVIVKSPKDIETPLLLQYVDGKIIHPTGTWKATYFSEELKAAAKYGYTYEIIRAYQFTRAIDLFKDFIDHFYELKKQATQDNDLTLKLISKLHLNTLYGMFGRKLDSLMCIYLVLSILYVYISGAVYTTICVYIWCCLYMCIYLVLSIYVYIYVYTH